MHTRPRAAMERESGWRARRTARTHRPMIFCSSASKTERRLFCNTLASACARSAQINNFGTRFGVTKSISRPAPSPITCTKRHLTMPCLFQRCIFFGASCTSCFISSHLVVCMLQMGHPHALLSSPAVLIVLVRFS